MTSEQVEPPTNPLLVPPRRETIHLYRDDVAKQIDALADQIDTLTDEIDELRAKAEDGGGPPKRMGKKSPLSTKAEERRKLAAEADALTEAPSVPMTFEEPTADAYTALQNAHPPRDEDRLDQLRGWNGDTFPKALVRLCLVEPVVSDEQWSEFVGSVSAHNWRRKILPTVQGLTETEPDLPKPFAVSTLQQWEENELRRQHGTESRPASSPE